MITMDSLAEKIARMMPKQKINIFGKDQLMNNTLPYYLLPTILSLVLFGELNNLGFLFIFIIYCVLPLLDEIFNLDLRNPSEEERRKLEGNDFYFRLPLYATILLDWLLFFKFMRFTSTLELTPISVFNLIGLIFIVSNLTAVQFAVAHQIFHKNSAFDKYLGTIHMVKNLYMHFTYEHLYGHHRRVATPEDPASAEKGITFYRFFFRSYFGSYRSVYKMQQDEKKPFWTNYAVLSTLASILFTSLMFKVYGIQGGIIYLLLAFGSILYLEAINYLEHYGLRREKKADGSYEKVTIRHSWNAPHRFSNYLLFKLQRHSDHHENSLKPYQTLTSLEESPHLPHGYTVTIFLSFFPSQWFKIMDPLVDQYNKTKKGDINGGVMAKAVFEVKKFIVKLSLVISGLFALSIMA